MMVVRREMRGMWRVSWGMCGGVIWIRGMRGVSGGGREWGIGVDWVGHRKMRELSGWSEVGVVVVVVVMVVRSGRWTFAC